MNPGIKPSGLFWTAMLPEDAVKVHSDDAGAEMRASNVHVLDYGDFANSLFGGGKPPVPATRQSHGAFNTALQVGGSCASVIGGFGFGSCLGGFGCSTASLNQ